MRKQITVDYISLGAGVQSTALLALEQQGKIYSRGVIFADTGEEPAWVYKTLNLLKKRHKTKIHTCRSHYESLSKFTFDKKFISAPVYMQKISGGLYHRSIGQRQCTKLFKIAPVLKEIRRLEGKTNKRLDKHAFRLALGISTDEAARARESRTHWIKNIFPLLELGLNRQDCKKLCKEVFGFIPEKSSCTFCPYKSKADFKHLKDNDKAGWKAACNFDDSIRDLKKNVKNFVYRGRIPLKEIDFTEPEKQMDFFADMCEEGGCGL